MEFAFNKIDIEPIFIIDYYLCQFSVKHILCKCTSVCWSSTNTYPYRSLVKGADQILPEVYGTILMEVLYIKNRKKFHLLYIPQTEINFQKWLNVESAMNGWLSFDTYYIIFVFLNCLYENKISFYICYFVYCSSYSIVYVLNFISITYLYF